MDKKKLKQLADYAVTEGLEHSEDGRWAVSYEELLYHFGVDVSDINEDVARCSQYNEAKVGTEITEGENELWL